jgi:hypothetical protein
MAETVYLETHSQKKIYGPYSAAAWNWDSIYGTQLPCTEWVLLRRFWANSLMTATGTISTKFTPQIAKDVEHPIETMMDESLKRLHTDYVDLYWIHNPATWKDGQRKSSPS